MVADLMASAPVGAGVRSVPPRARPAVGSRAPVDALFGWPICQVMALVEPNRIVTDKYFVPHEVYPMQLLASCLPIKVCCRYYPPYARGMSYALSEDLVLPLGRALAEGSLDPFPYREDVSVGLYLLQLAKRGEVGARRLRLPGQVRVVPHQRKDAMPLAAEPMKRGRARPEDFEEHCGARSQRPVIVMHRRWAFNLPGHGGEASMPTAGHASGASLRRGDQQVARWTSADAPKGRLQRFRELLELVAEVEPHLSALSLLKGTARRPLNFFSTCLAQAWLRHCLTSRLGLLGPFQSSGLVSLSARSLSRCLLITFSVQVSSFSSVELCAALVCRRT